MNKKLIRYVTKERLDFILNHLNKGIKVSEPREYGDYIAIVVGSIEYRIKKRIIL